MNPSTMSVKTLLLFTLSLFYGAASAQATVDPTNCMDPAGINGISPACWTALAINQHVTDWWATYEATCHPGTPFVQCFLQINNLGLEDCVDIISASCPPPSWNDFQGRDISVKDYYIAYNIYAMWSFFNGYWTAIDNARSAAQTSIGSIVALRDPPKKANGVLNDILTALSAGLPFLAPEVKPLTHALITGLQQAPGVAKYLFPVGTLDTQNAQFDQISNSMGTVTSYLQASVTSALAAVQADAVSFLAVTGSGNFSVNPLPTISQQSDGILTALNTYDFSMPYCE